MSEHGSGAGTGAGLPPVVESEQPVELRRSLSLVFWAWGIFGSFWCFTVSGASLTRMGQLLHLSEFGFGLLAAFPFAAALIQLPTSLFLERFGHHKPVFIVSGILHRSVWLLIALVPWTVPEGWQSRALLLLVLLSCVIGNVPAPSWMTWMANLVPRKIRGRFFSRRQQLGQLVGLLVTVCMGLLMDWAAKGGDRRLLAMLSIAMSLGGVSGVIDFLCFLSIPPPSLGGPNPGTGLLQLVRYPFSDPNFRRLIGYTATLTLGTGCIGQFLWLHAFDVSGWSNTQANLLIMVGPLIVAMISARFWGRLIDRLGRKPVLIICTALVVHGSVVWIFVTKEHWVLGYLGVMLAAFAWPGIDLSVFNILLALTESPRGRRHGSSYVAISSMVSAAAGCLSGLFGGTVASLLGDWRVMLFGRWPLTYHGVLFALSGVLRVAALLWLRGLQDKGAYRTRESLRHVGVSFYASLQDIVIVPARLVRQFGRWTYKQRP